MLYGESASTSRKLEVAASEIARLQNLLTMANQDRDKARAAATASQAEASRYKDQVRTEATKKKKANERKARAKIQGHHLANAFPPHFFLFCRSTNSFS
jgi:multidrug resistance efflux pump